MFWADTMKENKNKNKSNFIFIEIAYWLITDYQKIKSSKFNSKYFHNLTLEAYISKN
jgi:hypothetical protein